MASFALPRPSGRRWVHPLAYFTCVIFGRLHDGFAEPRILQVDAGLIEQSRHRRVVSGQSPAWSRTRRSGSILYASILKGLRGLSNQSFHSIGRCG